ncbi:Uncharacterised protein [Vibrio cholerae]|uniref:Uncharacterized protein n=1 Tax=Vibrio cholerae TaxID=666 RepID=A0A655XQY0_VIBCL|nr:Uncharacterised protein [Vibrio cholerae]CSB81795.1 Uncharacterised protein [Vibrio cholerae]CSC12692.1 Uncharacterised protein [Vibrio cholerae]CSC17877.1 Uncharacterised protein [Vibrio cholerae]CSC61409.1 Uncharacterised protein [Vibrio cholerae]
MITVSTTQDKKAAKLLCEGSFFSNQSWIGNIKSEMMKAIIIELM